MEDHEENTLLGAASILFFVAMAFAAPEPVVGDKRLLDTSHEQGLIINLDEFFAAHPLAEGQALRGDTVFKSPRVEVVMVTNRGPLIDLHYHATCEETVFVYKGQGEIYIDGKWAPVKAGDLHINPRGIYHTTRVVGKEALQVFAMFAPPQANGNDRVFLDRIMYIPAERFSLQSGCCADFRPG